MNLFYHLLYWVVVMVALTLFFGRNEPTLLESFYYASLLLPVAMATGYFLNYFLVPRYLLTGRVLRFFLYLFYSLILSVYLQLIVSVVALVLLANYYFEALTPSFQDVVVMAMIVYFIVLLGSLIQLGIKLVQREQIIRELEDSKEKDQSITVKVNRANVTIQTADIYYIESFSDYVKIHTLSGPLITRKKISHLEEQLKQDFLRIHRSYLVNKKRIESHTREYVTINKEKLPIGRSYKPTVISTFNTSIDRHNSKY
jgi:hypothetical protein